MDKEKMSDKVKVFFNKVNAVTFRNPFAKHEWVWMINEDSFIGVSLLYLDREGDENHLWVDLIYKKNNPPSGSASKVLKQICEFADETGVNLKLNVKPSKKFTDAKKIINKNGLRQWYARNGFISINKDFMTRQAK